MNDKGSVHEMRDYRGNRTGRNASGPHMAKNSRKLKRDDVATNIGSNSDPGNTIRSMQDSSSRNIKSKGSQETAHYIGRNPADADQDSIVSDSDRELDNTCMDAGIGAPAASQDVHGLNEGKVQQPEGNAPTGAPAWKMSTLDGYLARANEARGKRLVGSADSAGRKQGRGKDKIFSSRDFPPLGKTTTSKRKRQTDLSSDEEDYLDIPRKVARLENQYAIVRTNLSKEMAHNRQRNLVIYQFPMVKDERPGNNAPLVNEIVAFIDGKILLKEDWAASRVTTAFRIYSRTTPAPVVVRFARSEHAVQVISHCRNLRDFNTKLRRDGKRAVSVKRHYDPFTATTIQYLRAILNAMRVTERHKHCSVTLKDHPAPALVVDGRTFHMGNLPQELRTLAPVPIELE